MNVQYYPPTPHTHQGVRTSASTAPSGLDTKKVVEQNADVVVVEEAAGGRMVHEEGEDGKTLSLQVTQDHQVGHGAPRLNGLSEVTVSLQSHREMGWQKTVCDHSQLL